MSKSIFEILDINTREDSYTSLISEAFNSNRKFRTNLVSFFNLKISDDWESHLKTSINFKNKNRRKLIPDLLLVSMLNKAIVVLEVKVHSNEGYQQTQLYSSDNFKDSLNKKFNTEFSTFAYKFLTLDKLPAASSCFESINFNDIIKCLPRNLKELGLPLSLLLEEFKWRIDEYYDLKLNSKDLKVLDFFNGAKNLIDSKRLFEVGMKSILLNREYNYKYEVTNNRGDGVTHLVYWYKNHWNGKQISFANKGSETFEIHFEFHWHTGNPENQFCIYLHYHTHPYQTRDEIKNLKAEMIDKPNFFKEYEIKRNSFYEFLCQQEDKLYWNFKKTFLRIAHYNFNSNISFNRLEKQLEILTKELEVKIDAFTLNKKNHL